MSFADIDQDHVPPDDAFPTAFHTPAHVGQQSQTHTQANWQGQFQQDSYAHALFQEQPALLAESQFHYVQYRLGYAMTGHDQVDNAAQASMAGLGQICRPDQARRPGTGRTVDQLHRFSQQVAQMYRETPQGEAFLLPNSAAANHNSQYMMQPCHNTQGTSYQRAGLMQPNRGLRQPRDAGNLDDSHGQKFTQPTSPGLKSSSSGSASEHGHLHESNASEARSQVSTAPSHAKRERNKRRRQQTPEPPDSEGSGSVVDSAGDGDWRDSAPSKKRQRLESKPSTNKVSATKKTQKRDVKRTSNVVRHEFQQRKDHALLQDTDGNAVESAVFGVYELAGEQGYCERNQAPEIYRRNNMRALQCHYTLKSTSSTTDGLLFVRDPATGKKHRVTSMTFRISGVTSENEREDLPILESDNKRSKWTPTLPKPNVLPHIPPMSDRSVANGATGFHKSVGVGGDDPRSTHYEWSHLQFQAGTKHNGVRRTTQMFQFMRLSLIAEWGEGEHDRTKVASCSGQKYIVFARSPGGRKTLIKDDKEESEVTKRKGKSRPGQESTASPGPEQELGREQRKHNRRGLKAGKRRRQRRDESTPPSTPKAEPESESELLTERMRRRAAQVGRTPRDILHLPSRTPGQEPLAATSFNEEDQQSPRAGNQRADTPPAYVSQDLAEEELGAVSSPIDSPTDFEKSSSFGSPVPPASTEPDWRSQLERHTDVADESEVPTLTEGPIAPHGTTMNTPSLFDDDAIWEGFDQELEDVLEVKEEPNENVDLEQESPNAAGQMLEAEPDLLAEVGGNLADEPQMPGSSTSMQSPSAPPNLPGIGPHPSSTQSPPPASTWTPPDFAGLNARQLSIHLRSFPDPSAYLIAPPATQYVHTADNPSPFTPIGRADLTAYDRRQGCTAYNWRQQASTPTATINPSVLLNDAAGLGYDVDPFLGDDEDGIGKDLREFWSHQL